ncbi:MAG: Spermidine/putrescine import ABC transporter ATP-binding protein PotA [uncultured Nocardioidaceae bacterium]|uniref:Spermidine/putrescine import ABC transporter ATP-binding protein PotA n=1 Tax=uncultured Nocardioidaceae bacterium TaxID=253824 RepID=A0A6J4L4F0_9ACTN|nr:MAG: Spermidine/putrescine import ABC transporter ATP-binding protein PotA [uncultured Nocardioidaceae bacterium]
MTELLQVRDVVKRFGKSEVLSGVSLDVEEGEFITLLGPSGCGKTTLLRIIAGFESPTSGSVRLRGQELTKLPPHKRPVNTVFQRYLLFPHLDVSANVGFGLRISGLKRAEVKQRVSEALDLVRLGHLAERSAAQLSGGQAQRVSLARALVNRPSLLLLDEPLSALDLKVRLDMQSELRRIHRESGATFLYVTHDQQEAMSMSDRVVVMREGYFEQVGVPEELYHRPATAHVARFVGDANLVPVSRVRDGLVFSGTAAAVPGDHPKVGDAELFVARPEGVRIVPVTEGAQATVVDVAFLGSAIEYRVQLGEHIVRVQEHGSHSHTAHGVGDEVGLRFDSQRTFLLADDQIA